jgi:AbrB family looped-hinge helix DNA binding protein
VVPVSRAARNVRTRLSSKGQVVIPKELRDRFHLREGDELLVEESDDAIILRVVRKTDVELFGGPVGLDRVLGALARRGTARGPLSLEDMDRLAAAGARARWAKRKGKR